MDRYLHYTIEDFAFDDDFVKWVQSSFLFQNEKWLDLQNQEKYKENISEAILLVQSMAFEKETYPNDRKEKLWSSIDKETKELLPSQEKKSHFNSAKIIKYLIPLAASFLLLIYLSNSNSGPSTFETQLAEVENVSLPDGSTININALSSLSYDNKEFKQARTIALEGEAFFKVEKGHTFKVITSHGTIEVLGTSFNIYSRPEGFEVSCHTGKVKVESADKLWTVFLEAGQKCYLGDDGRLKRMYGGEKDKDWISGVHHFEKTPLDKVMKEFQRHYDVEISLTDKIKSTAYTGSFETKNIDDALYMICWPLKLTCELKDGVVHLKE